MAREAVKGVPPALDGRQRSGKVSEQGHRRRFCGQKDVCIARPDPEVTSTVKVAAACFPGWFGRKGEWSKDGEAWTEVVEVATQGGRTFRWRTKLDSSGFDSVGSYLRIGDKSFAVFFWNAQQALANELAAAYRVYPSVERAILRAIARDASK